MRLALQILQLALELKLDLQAVWVSRQDPRLQKADALSKHVNLDDKHGGFFGSGGVGRWFYGGFVRFCQELKGFFFFNACILRYYLSKPLTSLTVLSSWFLV
jgi:hypothetical protein